MKQTVENRNGHLYINGVDMVDAPIKAGGNTIVQRGKNLYINGYQYKGGEWKRTLSALLNCFFC